MNRTLSMPITIRFESLLGRLILLVFLSQIGTGALQAQDPYERMSKKICKCFEGVDAPTMEDFTRCIELELIENLSRLLEFHSVETLTELFELGVYDIIAANIYTDCQSAEDFVHEATSEIMPTFEPTDVEDCSALKLGDYFYLTPRFDSDVVDTTFVTFTETAYLERMLNGRTYSLLDVDWTSDCEFELTFLESNDPLKKTISNSGDKYFYQIIQNHEKVMIVNTEFDGYEFQIEFFKIPR